MDVDVYGNPWARSKKGRICGKYTGVFVALKGDQKFLQRALKLTTSGTSDQVCMFCRATSNGPLLYTAFGPHAPHRQTLVSNTDFMIHGCKPNSWIRLPGFHVSRVLTDWLHLIDLSLVPEVCASVSWFCLCTVFFVCLCGLVYANLFQDFSAFPWMVGSQLFSCFHICLEVLVELTEDETVWPGDSRDERLRQAFVQFTAECKRHRVSDLAIMHVAFMFFRCLLITKETEAKSSVCDLS